MQLIAVVNIDKFYEIYGRLGEAGKDPHWFGFGGVLYICSKETLNKVKQKYGNISKDNSSRDTQRITA